MCKSQTYVAILKGRVKQHRQIINFIQVTQTNKSHNPIEQEMFNLRLDKVACCSLTYWSCPISERIIQERATPKREGIISLFSNLSGQKFKRSDCWCEMLVALPINSRYLSVTDIPHQQSEHLDYLDRHFERVISNW